MHLGSRNNKQTLRNCVEPTAGDGGDGRGTTLWGGKTKLLEKRGKTVFWFRRAATSGNMDTLFSRFLGLLLLLSAAGIVSGQMPTGKPMRCTNSTLLWVICVVKEGKFVFVCFAYTIVSSVIISDRCVKSINRKKLATREETRERFVSRAVELK